MWTTFLVALKANLRNRSALFWMTVFPIVLATMFNGLFGGLAEAYELKPVPMAVIEDTRWQQADGARRLGKRNRPQTTRPTPKSTKSC